MMRILMAIALVSFGSAAYAGSLINKDDQSYDLKISCGGGTANTSIGSKTTQSGRVRKGCVIELNGAKYKVEGDGNVTIKGGSISE